MKDNRTRKNLDILLEYYCEFISPKIDYSSLDYFRKNHLIYQLKYMIIERISILLNTDIFKYKKNKYSKSIYILDELTAALEDVVNESEKKYYNRLKKLLKKIINLYDEIEENKKSINPKDMTEENKEFIKLKEKYINLTEGYTEDRLSKISGDEILTYILILYIMDTNRYKNINLLIKLRRNEWEIIPEAERKILLMCIKDIIMFENWEDISQDINYDICRNKIMQPIKFRTNTYIHEIICFFDEISDLKNCESESFMHDNYKQLDFVLDKIYALKEIYNEKYDNDAETDFDICKYENINNYIESNNIIPDKDDYLKLENNDRIRFCLTKVNYECIKNHFPIQRGNVKIDNFKFLNAILYVADRKIKWCKLPPEFGKWDTIYKKFIRWKKNGNLIRIFKAMVEENIFSEYAINMYMEYFEIEDDNGIDNEINFDEIKETPLYNIFKNFITNTYNNSTEDSDNYN